MISGHSNTAEHAALQLLHLVAGTAQPVTVRLVLWKTLAVNGKGRWNWHIVRADGICGLRMIQRPLSLKFMILFLGSYVIGGQIVFVTIEFTLVLHIEKVMVDVFASGASQ
jgi:hypothetical protein